MEREREREREREQDKSAELTKEQIPKGMNGDESSSHTMNVYLNVCACGLPYV